ncbi:hypothetical protein KM043_007713 [Ampulex compressa]|nr:hypothetical protein KM043_007713 [Ampulex compressa]
MLNSIRNRYILSNAWGMSNDFKGPPMEDLLMDKGFNDGCYLPGGMMDPTKKQVFTCTLCGKEYTWMYSLRRHQLQCGNKEAMNKCQFCSKKFYRRDRLKEHLLAHHSNLAV